MTTMAALRLEEQEQDERVVLSELGKAIHDSLETLIHEPLPNELASLVLQLGLAETGNEPNGELLESYNLTLTQTPETELVRATRRVAKARLIVERQRARVAELQAEHRPTEDALSLLHTFSNTLANLEFHQRLLRDEAEAKDRKAEWIFARLVARFQEVYAA